MMMMAPLLRLLLCSVFMSTSMETAFDLILPIGVTGGCLLISGVPRFHGLLKPVCQTWTLFTSSFGCNFPKNDNQTYIVYMKSTLILFRKGLCGFFPLVYEAAEQNAVSGFTLEEKLRGGICRICFKDQIPQKKSILCKLSEHEFRLGSFHETFLLELLQYYHGCSN